MPITDATPSDQTAVVLRYFDGCQAGEVEAIRATLAPDVAHYFLGDDRPLEWTCTGPTPTGQQHTSIVKSGPGLRRWVQNRVTTTSNESACDGIGELWFDSPAARCQSQSIARKPNRSEKEGIHDDQGDLHPASAGRANPRPVPRAVARRAPHLDR